MSSTAVEERVEEVLPGCGVPVFGADKRPADAPDRPAIGVHGSAAVERLPPDPATGR